MQRTGLPCSGDERGLIDADRLGKELFGLMHRLFDTLERGATDSLQLRNVELLFSDEPGAGLLVETASLQHPAGQGVEIEATLVFAGRKPEAQGQRGPVRRRRSHLRSASVVDHGPAGPIPQNSPLDRHVNAVELAISGSEDADGFGRLAMTVRATDACFFLVPAIPNKPSLTSN